MATQKKKKRLWDTNPRFQIDTLSLTFYGNIFRTSAVSSTNIGSIFTFSSCLLVLVIYDVGKFFLNGRGPILLVKKNVFLHYND